LESSKKSFKTFASFQDYLTYLAVYDSSKQAPVGYHESKKLAIWAKNGKSFLTLDTFVSLANACRFDLVECPYDDQNTRIESKKSIKKSLERTKFYVDGLFSKDQEPPPTNKSIDKVFV
jgi:hypothetical protein